MACSLSNNFIAMQCLLVFVWLRILLVRSESAPTINPLITEISRICSLSLNVQHNKHPNATTIFASVSSGYTVQPHEWFYFFVEVLLLFFKSNELNTSLPSSSSSSLSSSVLRLHYSSLHAYASCVTFTRLLILSGCHNCIKFVLGGYDYNLCRKWPTAARYFELCILSININ